MGETKMHENHASRTGEILNGLLLYDALLVDTTQISTSDSVAHSTISTSREFVVDCNLLNSVSYITTNRSGVLDLRNTSTNFA